MASTAPNSALKRSDSITDSMPEALKQSRFHMKRCFARYYIYVYVSIVLQSKFHLDNLIV